MNGNKKYLNNINRIIKQNRDINKIKQNKTKN